MGKGDRKTRRGKIRRGTTGNTRRKIPHSGTRPSTPAAPKR
jgi:ribosomal small subunit protein bTHX